MTIDQMKMVEKIKALYRGICSGVKLFALSDSGTELLGREAKSVSMAKILRRLKVLMSVQPGSILTSRKPA